MTRTLARLRTGAEKGAAQVLTPAETLELLNRIEELERIERAAEDFVTRTDDLEDEVGKLEEALATRRSGIYST